MSWAYFVKGLRSSTQGTLYDEGFCSDGTTLSYSWSKVRQVNHTTENLWHCFRQIQLISWNVSFPGLVLGFIPFSHRQGENPYSGKPLFHLLKWSLRSFHQQGGRWSQILGMQKALSILTIFKRVTVSRKRTWWCSYKSLSRSNAQHNWREKENLSWGQ